ncbi:AMP-binding protein, partial [archaeon]|nr:AMP-binding protein [archaeon]
MSEFEFIPTEKQIQESNIYKFMKKHKLSSFDELSQKSANDLEWFWKSVAEDIGIVWDSPYEKVLDNSKGIAWSKWFVNGKTNIYKSSVEKFVKISPDKIAYYFESETGEKSKITYSKLDSKVSKLANGLKSLGIRKGDVVAIYLPMIEEAFLSILAAAKIGAIQTIIFSGYSSDSLHVRLKDCNAKILITSDGFHRKGKTISQKQSV